MRSDPLLYTPEPTDDGFDTLYSPVYGQTHHSKHGALTEARHVFLEGTGVAERLAQRLPTRVLEVGFGTGLNFLLTAHEAALADVLLRYRHAFAETLSLDLVVGDAEAALPNLAYDAVYLDAFSQWTVTL